MRLPEFINFKSNLGELEGEFRTHYFSADIEQASFALSVSSLFALAMTILDYLFFGTSTDYYILLAARVTFGFFSLGIISALRKSKDNLSLSRLILLWGMVLVVLTLYIETTRPPDYSQSSTTFVLFALMGYVMIPIRPLLRAILPTTMTIGYLWIALAIKDFVNPIWIGATVSAFLIMHFAGLATALWTFNARKQQFLTQYELRMANAKLTLLATTDDLTGIHNRRHFLERANDEFARFKRNGHPFAIMIADLDLLKKINDQYGHDAGDLAICQFTKMVTREKRSSDVFGRLGGEEFGLLMPDTNLEQAKVVVDRIFAQRKLMMIYIGTAEVRVAFTAGVAEALPHHQTFDNILRAADRALYRGKNQGRDRYELAEGEIVTSPLLK